jgi:hypothetical protein
MDTISIEILPDGSIKAVTDKIGAANHSTAEAFMRSLATAGGGEQTRKHKHGVLGAVIHAAQHAIGGTHKH